MKPIVLISILSFNFLFVFNESKAQGDQKFITFSGFVIDEQTDEPLAGTRIMNEQSGKGIYANEKGYFILDVFPGDTLRFYFLGFKPQYHVIPKSTGLSYSAVVALSINAKMLKEVKVYPFRTEEEFKLAFLSMDAPNDEERRLIERNLGSSTLRSLAMAAPMGAAGNYRYAIDRQLLHMQSQKMLVTNPLFDAGSWINFIKTVKSGEAFKGMSGGNSNLIQEKTSREDIFKAGQN